VEGDLAAARVGEEACGGGNGGKGRLGFRGGRSGLKRGESEG